MSETSLTEPNQRGHFTSRAQGCRVKAGQGVADATGRPGHAASEPSYEQQRHGRRATSDLRAAARWAEALGQETTRELNQRDLKKRDLEPTRSRANEISRKQDLEARRSCANADTGGPRPPLAARSGRAAPPGLGSLWPLFPGPQARALEQQELIPALRRQESALKVSRAATLRRLQAAAPSGPGGPGCGRLAASLPLSSQGFCSVSRLPLPSPYTGPWHRDSPG